ncbi:MAG: acetyl-CoA carboxylase, biotin carboxyl carrier protein [Flavobacteriales bacterium]|nr:acetyl-CoA carboxylase, biotin carboxyl carrier protein [Flavobacteriales bacterium]|tara:strand:- start:1257 stop:1766 length:510 start_codon:yes stop_codon:yes gene_type:complete
MDIKDIQELIKFVAKSGATEVDLEIDNVKISIKSPAMKAGKVIEPPVTLVSDMPVATPVVAATPVAAVAASPTPSADTTAETEAKDDTSQYITVKSPMIGTFYRKPSPDKDAFVNVGDEIKPGDVLCVVEAMKLFNEIESEVSGKIVKVLADDSSPVEYDQTLFLVDPS